MLLSLLLLACKPDPSPKADDSFSYPLDDSLAFQHIQAKGTHNSYHVETSPVIYWAYTHLPLGQQASEQGVRQFELDIGWDEDAGAFDVHHVDIVDEGTTCPMLTDCAQDLKDWSDANPAHQPLLVLLELKDGFDAAYASERLAALESELLSVWPEDRIITPDDVQGDADSLKQAVEAEGWPSLGALRGRILWVLHEAGGWRDTYTEGGSTSAGRLMFPDAQGDLSLPIAAVHTINDPYDPRIPEVVALNHLVRTRADADLEEAYASDTSRRDQALASGAHFISTDFPGPVEGFDYVVEIPGGTPSRCNPLTAPPECSAEALEDPAFIE